VSASRGAGGPGAAGSGARAAMASAAGAGAGNAAKRDAPAYGYCNVRREDLEAALRDLAAEDVLLSAHRRRDVMEGKLSEVAELLRTNTSRLDKILAYVELSGQKPVRSDADVRQAREEAITKEIVEKFKLEAADNSEHFVNTIVAHLERHQRRTEDLLTELLDSRRLGAALVGPPLEHVAERLEARIAVHLKDCLPERLPTHMSDSAADSADSAAPIDYTDNRLSSLPLRQPSADEDMQTYTSESDSRPCVEVRSLKTRQAFHEPWDTLQGCILNKTPIEDLVSAAGWNRSAMDYEEVEPTQSTIIQSKRLMRFLTSGLFSFICMSMIVLNAALVGYQSGLIMQISKDNYHSRINNQKGLGLQEPVWINICDYIFSVFFCVELLFRIAAEQMFFLTGPYWKWNIFDALLVASAVLEKLLDSFTNLSFFRLLRICRAFRAVRVIRIVRWLTELRVMIISIVKSFSSFVWALVFIFSVKFLFAVVFIQGAAYYLDRSDPDDPEIHGPLNINIPEAVLYLFSSVDKMIIILFATVTGGVDWFEVYGILARVGPGYGILFVVYVSFMLLGIMNVIVGIFVDVSNRSSSLERDKISKSEYKYGSDMAEVKEALSRCDVDANGSLSELEFLQSLESHELLEALSAQDIDKTEALGVFKLLLVKSEAGTSEVDIDQFIVGLLLTKGGNRDLLSVWYEIKQVVNKYIGFASFLNEHFMYQEEILRTQAETNRRTYNCVAHLQDV